MHFLESSPLLDFVSASGSSWVWETGDSTRAGAEDDDDFNTLNGFVKWWVGCVFGDAMHGVA